MVKISPHSHRNQQTNEGSSLSYEQAGVGDGLIIIKTLFGTNTIGRQPVVSMVNTHKVKTLLLQKLALFCIPLFSSAQEGVLKVVL